MGKPHAKYDCPCTDCQKWYRDEIERLKDELNRRGREECCEDYKAAQKAEIERLGEENHALRAVIERVTSGESDVHWLNTWYSVFVEDTGP